MNRFAIILACVFALPLASLARGPHAPLDATVQHPRDSVEIGMTRIQAKSLLGMADGVAIMNIRQVFEFYRKLGVVVTYDQGKRQSKNDPSKPSPFGAHADAQGITCQQTGCKLPETILKRVPAVEPHFESHCGRLTT